MSINLRRKSANPASFLDRSLSTLSVGSRSRAQANDDVRGPLGLSLLYSPPEPLIDFIFVHGLKGGSRKTWASSEDPESYWPQQWLPQEPRFRNVRIHTFGYDSDWGVRRESQLSVHDFGQSLLGEILNSPDICGHDQPTAIVLVGHSMGGIVIKKVLLLAKQDPNCADLWSRFHSMFFLATPHRGADSADLLKKMMHLTGQKAYVEDLRPGSTNTQVINDEFRNIYGNIQLYSFYETLPMSHVGIIVERQSAVLGFPSERVQLLNADHRHVCKFDNRLDSNYCSVRNAFISAIDSIEKQWLSSRRNVRLSQMQILSQYLDVTEKPEAELARVTQRQTDGTCIWLERNAHYLDWSQLRSKERVFWLEGEPASGKSTVAGHVIRLLEKSGDEHAYFFFKHGDTTRSMAATLLRSFAWQMASMNADCRAELLSMAEQGHFFDKNDEGSVWRNIFLARMLKLSWHEPCYWIIDALDECGNYASLFPLFSKLEEHHPLRIFITGRPLLAVDRLFSHEKLPRLAVVMSITDSLEDIKLFLTANADFLPAEDEHERDMLVRRILNRSNGNFLWTSLVLQELADTPSVQQAYTVLDDVPNGMDDLYSRILNAIMVNHRTRDIAKVILKWVVCAMRPLLLDELKEALQLDIKDTLPRLEQTIGSITGSLVVLDADNKVQLVHQTVRSFLMREDALTEALTTFGVVRVRDNLMLSTICLKYLNGPEFRTQRHRRSSVSNRPTKRSSFAAYAIAHFSDHVIRSSAEDTNLLNAIHTFLNTNSLTWIEVVAQSGDLSLVVRAARNLRHYIKKRSKLVAPIGEALQDVESWASDLARVVASFGKPILMLPSSIQFLIPPICPANSIVARKFAQYPHSLALSGLSNNDWDDRVSCIIYADTQVLSLASHDESFAVGLSDGTARVVSLATTQEQRCFKHSEQVRLIRFSVTDRLLSTASRKRICVWDLNSGEQRWDHSLDSPILCMEFSAEGSSLLALTNRNLVSTWDAMTGELTQQFDVFDVDETTGQKHPHERVPIQGHFSPGMNLLAVAYRQRPVVIWELIEDTCDYVGSYTKNARTYPGPLLLALKFNPKPEIGMMAAAYDDGDLVVFDPYSQRTCARISQPVAKMHGSNDGTCLVVGNGTGKISLFDFETLHLLYQIDSYEMAVREFAFSSDSKSLLEVRGNHCNIWEPPILSHSSELDEVASTSFSEDQSVTITSVAFRGHDDARAITALTISEQSSLAFCGREDGSVSAHSTSNGSLVYELNSHQRNVAVRFVEATSTGKTLATVDRSGRLLVQSMREGSHQFHVIIDNKSSDVVKQVLLNANGTKLLISTETKDEVRRVPDMQSLGCVNRSDSITRRWAQHPLRPEILLLASSTMLEVYEWEDLSRISGHLAATSPPVGTTQPVVGFKTAWRSRRVCALQGAWKVNLLEPRLEIYDLNLIDAGKQVISPVAVYADLAKDIKIMIGIYETSLLFLTHQGWLCSLELSGPTQEHFYTRHFFIPFKYHNNGRKTYLGCNKAGNIVLNYGSEIAVFQNGLNFNERVHFEAGRSGASVPPTRVLTRANLRRGNSAPSC